MTVPPGSPGNEIQRLTVQGSLQLPDHTSQERCDTLTRLAVRVFDVPMAVVTLLDGHRQRVESRIGLEASEVEASIRSDENLGEDICIVEDTLLDQHFAHDSMVLGAPEIRFIAIVAIRDRLGNRLGRLAIMDRRPRQMSKQDLTLLRDISRFAVLEAERIESVLRHARDETALRESQARLLESEAHMRLLDRIGEATRSVTDATEIMAITARLLGRHLGATRTAYADVEADNDRFHIRADWSVPDVPSSTGTYSLALFGPLAVANLRRGIDLVVRDVDAELGDEGGARMFTAIGIKAIICAGLVKRGSLVAMMAVHQSRPRIWRDCEIVIVREVVERCWAHIERVRDAAKLREQDRRKDEFLATLAHELRNPLAPLRYASAILRRVPPGEAQAIASQDMIDRQVGHMTRLIDDLLDLSRINRGLISLRRETVELRGLMEQAAETTRPQLQQAGHSLQMHLPDQIVAIFGDPTRIIQAIGNLLNNAVKYTPSGGRVRLAAWTSEGRVFIEVADNGIGIPPEHQGLMFQMFTQLPHSAGRAQGGLGIGLALVKTLVRLHDGDIRVFSAGLDEGSTFTIDLPLARTKPAQVQSATSSMTDAPGKATLRVLVVEDNPDGLASLLTLLQVMGYETMGAADGLAGLAAAESFRPHVVLLDLGLPEVDGLEVARRLRSLPHGKNMALIALTGWGSESDRRRTSEAGFNCHVTKPIGADMLRKTIERHAVEWGHR